MMLNKMRKVDILLPIVVDRAFTYILPRDVVGPLSAGRIVKVPFRNKILYGVVWEGCKENAVNNCIAKYKTVIEVLPLEFSLQSSAIDFIKYVANYNVADTGSVLKMFLSLLPSQFEKILEKQKEAKVEALLASYDDQENTKDTIQLNEVQSQVANKIVNLADTFGVSLIYGVTGSGKTETYLWLAKQVLRKGGQVLILIPEIVLTTQLIQRFAKYISSEHILQWHSSLTPAKRREAWRKVCYEGKENESLLVVGARSALFLPFSNLQLIIVDEEHDVSFKQDEGVTYNARDMAVVRGKIENKHVILSSATPSIETMHNVQKEKYKYYELPCRYSKVATPNIKIADLSVCKRGFQWLHDKSRAAIRDILEKNKQVMIFLNRRGYAPAIFCTQCASNAQCLNCHTNLVYHKSEQKLRCHHCGHFESYSGDCIVCGASDTTVLYGPGVERIAEEIKSFIPNPRLLVLTSDTTNTQQKAREAIGQIVERKVDIIVGTQMIAKGLDFPELQLVIVVDADPDTLGCDIRALERTYQILNQVMGRAGRREDVGLGIVQTHHPDSKLIKYISEGRLEEFVEMELQNRKESYMPPLTRLVTITLSAKKELVLLEFIKEMRKNLPQVKSISYGGCEVFGPHPAPIAFLRNLYRYRVTIRAQRSFDVQTFVRRWLDKCKIPSTVRCKIDVDPQWFL
jgi:primosomal protein N' (replication factor Y) (superfamily II helicase)